MKKNKRGIRVPLPLPDGTLFRHGKTEEEGVILLLWRVEIPAFDAAFGKTDAASFYETLAARAESFLAGRFSDQLREEYRRADPVRRRFTFRPAIYRHAVTGVFSDGAVSIERAVTLKRAGRVLFARDFCEKWDPADGSFLLDREEKDRTAAPEKRTKKSGKKVDAGAGGML